MKVQTLDSTSSSYFVATVAIAVSLLPWLIVISSAHIVIFSSKLRSLIEAYEIN